MFGLFEKKAKLQAFADIPGEQCWSRVKYPKGDPVFIGIAQSGLLVAQSRRGILGEPLFECDAFLCASMAQELHEVYNEYPLPEHMTSPVLRAFTQFALDGESVDEFVDVLLFHQSGFEPPAEFDRNGLIAHQKAERLWVGQISKFASLMKSSKNFILDANLLPCSKDELHKAFDYYLATENDPKQIEIVRILRIRLFDWQKIDPEDEKLVSEVNKHWDVITRKVDGETATPAEIEWYKNGFALHHKYFSRGVSETKEFSGRL